MTDATFLITMADDLAREMPLRRGLRWTFIEADNSVGHSIAPSTAPPFLYRGQNAHHQPCLPTICRRFEPLGPYVDDLCRRDQLLLVKYLAQGRWFERILDVHPAVRWAVAQGLRLDRVGLSQHYGIPTGYVDLTESFDVAAFFATCFFDTVANEWCPCDAGEGVLYRVHWARIPREPKRVRWIGLHPLPRPAEQWGWTCELFLGEDFEQAPFLQILPFKHCREAGEHFLRTFSQGEALFPSDPMSRVADRIVDAQTLPLWTLTETIADLLADEHGLHDVSEAELFRVLEDAGVAAAEDCPSPIHDADIDELERIWETRKSDFLKGVGSRLVRTPKDEDEATA